MTGGLGPHPLSGSGAALDADNGSTALEMSILAPVLFLLVFAIVQVGLWAHGQQLAAAAAARGASAAAAYRSSTQAGTAEARSFLLSTAGGSLREVRVSSSSNGGSVRVDVRARSLSVVPGLAGLPVHAEAVESVERVTYGR